VTPRKRNPVWAKAGAYTGLAFVIPAAMYAGHWLGSQADASLGTRYWSVVGLLLGFAAAVYEVYRHALRIEKIGKDK
jgi:F0F1-type ATP synthase assembly protein I